MAATESGATNNSSQLPSFVHAIQPILIYDALLRPTSDLEDLAHQIYTIAFMHNIAFSELVYEILRSLLLSISQQSGLETLKIDDFILIKLPILLEKLYLQIKAGIGLGSDNVSNNSGSSAISTGTLKKLPCAT